MSFAWRAWSSALFVFLALSYSLRGQKQTLLLSEIMPKASAAGAEFVELFNASSGSLDLAAFGIALRKEGRLGRIYPLTSVPYALAPGEYVAITPNKSALLSLHNVEAHRLVEQPKLPALPNGSGCVVLLRLGQKPGVVEEMVYEGSSYPQGKIVAGVSLERLAFWMEARQAESWAAALPESGGATPGRANSHAVDGHELHDPPMLNQLPAYLQALRRQMAQLSCTMQLYRLSGELLLSLSSEEIRSWLGATDGQYADLQHLLCLSRSAMQHGRQVLLLRVTLSLADHGRPHVFTYKLAPLSQANSSSRSQF